MLDTNVLTGLYRLSLPARKDALAALKVVQDRLWIPHQVGVEFLRNLNGVRGELPAAHSKVRVAIDKAKNEVVAAFGDEKRFAESRSAVAEAVDEALLPLLDRLAEIAAADPAKCSPEADPLLEDIEKLLEGRVGVPSGPDRIRLWVEEFMAWRAPNQIPPGWKDAGSAKKHTDLLRAGDYILWRQLLEHASTVSVPFLFVTNDGKDDWWAGERGQRTGAHPGLIEEFAAVNTQGYHQMSFERFLSSLEAIGANAAAATVEEVAEGAALDEVYPDVLDPDALHGLVEELRSMRDLGVVPDHDGVLALIRRFPTLPLWTFEFAVEAVFGDEITIRELNVIKRAVGYFMTGLLAREGSQD